MTPWIPVMLSERRLCTRRCLGRMCTEMSETGSLLLSRLVRSQREWMEGQPRHGKVSPNDQQWKPQEDRIQAWRRSPGLGAQARPRKQSRQEVDAPPLAAHPFLSKPRCVLCRLPGWVHAGCVASRTPLCSSRMSRSSRTWPQSRGAAFSPGRARQ